VGSTDPALVRLGWPCVPLDAWSVAVTSVFQVVQNNRSTDRAFGLIFGMSTRVCAPSQKPCLVSSSDDIGWIGRSPTLEVFCVLNFNNTKRRHVHMFYWWQHTSRTQSLILFKLSLLFKSSNIVGTFTREIKREIELKKSKWTN